MNYNNIHIRRFIIYFIIVFGFLGPLFITAFAYFFGLTFIQEKYVSNYIQTTFHSFDSDLGSLIKQNNLILFDIASDENLQKAFLNEDIGQPERRKIIQSTIENQLSKFTEIRQIDIISDSFGRYTYVSPIYNSETPLSLPSQEFLSSLTNRSLNLCQECVLDKAEDPCLVFGRDSELGTLILYMSEYTISSLYESNSLKNSTIYLTINGRIISCSNQDYIGKESSYPQTKIASDGLLGKPDLYKHTINIAALGSELELVYIPSDEDLHQVLERLNRVLIEALLAAMAICLFLMLLVSKKLFMNIRKLQSDLSVFSLDYTHVFEADESSELASLEVQFEKMSRKIRTLIQDIEREKDEKRIAELKALQSQINPHFIYNSIDSISWMAKLNKPYSDIERLSYYLGLFFRLGLHKGDTVITVAEEIQHVNSYLEIEKIRFPNLFDVRIELAPEVADLKIIKIILQPIVENTINHGFEGINYKGLITIQARTDERDSDCAVFTVTDNGIGIDISDASLPKSRNTHGGYALKNVNERLCLEYGSSSGLSFISSPGNGTRVSFRISKSKMVCSQDTVLPEKEG